MLCWLDDHHLLHCPPQAKRAYRLPISPRDRIVSPLFCRAEASPFAQRNLEELELLWWTGDSSEDLQFIGHLGGAQYCLWVKMAGAHRWCEGDRNEVLATVPDHLFDAANRALLGPPLRIISHTIDASERLVGVRKGRLVTVPENTLGSGDRVHYDPDLDRVLIMRVSVFSNHDVREEEPYFEYGTPGGPYRSLELSPPERQAMGCIGWSSALCGRRLVLHYWEEMDGSYAPTGWYGDHFAVFSLPEGELVAHEDYSNDLRASEIQLGSMALNGQGEIADVDDGELTILVPGTGEEVFLSSQVVGKLEVAFSGDGDALAIVSHDGEGVVLRREKEWRLGKD